MATENASWQGFKRPLTSCKAQHMLTNVGIEFPREVRVDVSQQSPRTLSKALSDGCCLYFTNEKTEAQKDT